MPNQSSRKSSPEASFWKKVTFEVHTVGTQARITAHLPNEFTMRQFTRMYDLRHAPELGMTNQEYALWQSERLKEDLMLRIKEQPRDSRLLS